MNEEYRRGYEDGRSEGLRARNSVVVDKWLERELVLAERRLKAALKVVSRNAVVDGEVLRDAPGRNDRPTPREAVRAYGRRDDANHDIAALKRLLARLRRRE